MENDILDPDRVPGPFGLAEDYDRVDGSWHRHGRPQLLYAVEGCLRLWAAGRVAVLPPTRAAWLPAGLLHRVEAGRPVRLRTVYFGEEPGEPAGARVEVFVAPPLLREMSVQACAWDRGADLPEIGPFYIAFRHLVERWRAEPLGLDLPAATDPALGRALAWLLDHLDRPVGLADVERIAGLSARTLQRHCRRELGMSLQSWLGRARALRGLELLADPRVSVAAAAERVGYESTAAFSRAFRLWFRAAPSEMRGARR